MESLFLVAGLGNPGSQYAETRHNIGFAAVEKFGGLHRALWTMEDRFQARLAKVEIGGRRGLLCQPQTFMNSSGEPVQSVLSFYKIDAGSMLVVVDDADLPFGELRMRPSGGAGGHHGLESIERMISAKGYGRLRIGIGRQTSGQREIAGHVLGRFEVEERCHLPVLLSRVAAQIECWITSGIDKAMNEFNGGMNPPVAKEAL